MANLCFPKEGTANAVSKSSPRQLKAVSEMRIRKVSDLIDLFEKSAASSLSFKECEPDVCDSSSRRFPAGPDLGLWHKCRGRGGVTGFSTLLGSRPRIWLIP